MNRPKDYWLQPPEQAGIMMAAMQFKLDQTARMPPETLWDMQWVALNKLLKHSVGSCRYYQKPAYMGIKSLEEFRTLPILTRSDLQENFNQLLSDARLDHHGKQFEFKSSGSTGKPVTTITTEHAQFYWQALTLRDHLWQKRTFTSKLGAIKFIQKPESKYPGIQSSSWGGATSQLFETGSSCILDSSESIDTQIKWLNENKPDYILTYPSLIKELAKVYLELKQNKNLSSTLFTPKGISTLGETLTDDTRKLAKSAFGLNIKDMYSSQEVGYMALQCPEHDHYHIQSESVFLEILDEDDQPCKPGQLGRIIVTPLHNFRMPLLRYEIGDYGILGETCDCGINLPVLKSIKGRTRNLVTYPSGKKSWPAYNPMKLMEWLPNCQYQIVQDTIEQLTLRVSGASKLTDEDAEKVKQTIQEAIGHPFKIDIEHVDRIERSKSGKFEEFISKVG